MGYVEDRQEWEHEKNRRAYHRALAESSGGRSDPTPAGPKPTHPLVAIVLSGTALASAVIFLWAHYGSSAAQQQFSGWKALAGFGIFVFCLWLLMVFLANLISIPSYGPQKRSWEARDRAWREYIARQSGQ